MKIKTTIIILMLAVVNGNVHAGTVRVTSIVDSATNSRVEVIEGEILVKFKAGTGKTAMGLINKNLGGQRISEIRGIRVHRMKIHEGRSINEMLELYRNNPDVEYAEPNYIRKAFKIPIDTYFGSQWGLHDASGDMDIDAPEAWDIETGSSSVVIAVIDSGINYNHLDLKDNMWVNTGETADGDDTDLNGYIDDIRGWDFGDEDNDPMDELELEEEEEEGEFKLTGHGTSVAGVAAASGNNGMGIAGVAWNAGIMNVKVFFKDPEDGEHKTGVAMIVAGIEYAADNGADIINLSLGQEILDDTQPAFSQSEYDAIVYAVDKGCLVIAATGNDSNKLYITNPAGYANVFAVGASTMYDKRAYYSNYGSGIDVVAPGSSIFTTLLSSSSNSSYASMSGTSFATPMVSGLAALMKSRFGGLVTNEEIKDIIRGSCDDIMDAGYDLETGYGRINARGALGAEFKPDETRELSAANTPNPFVTSKHSSTKIFFTTTYDNSPRRITIYNIMGAQVFRTYDIDLKEILKDGQRVYEYDWDGKNDSGKNVLTGIYVYVIENQKGAKKGKIALIR